MIRVARGRCGFVGETADAVAVIEATIRATNTGRQDRRQMAAGSERGASATLCAMPLPAVDGGRLPAVVARSVSKSFTVRRSGGHTLKERALHPRRRIRHQTFRALNDISFAVAPGEFFGIAGRNGSGKSTLLKCIAGIYQAEGDIWCRGRLSTFIELGVGFNPDMAARDNVVMNGIMLGLTRARRASGMRR